jgi:hypothetical protein
MKYLKITTENASALLVDGAILSHCKEILPENELDEITVDRIVDIVNRVDSEGVIIIMPDGTDSSRYEIDYFTNGNWWVEDFSKAKQLNYEGRQYVSLLCTVILLPLGIYMFINSTSMSGFQGPGRFGGYVTSGRVSAPFVLILGFISLGVYIAIVRDNRKKNK